MGASQTQVDVNFLNNYWNRLHQIKDEITVNLQHDLKRKSEPVDGCKFLRLTQFSKLENWSVEKNSSALTALSDKIRYMIDKGRTEGMLRMIKAICTNRIKHFKSQSYYSSIGKKYEHDTFDESKSEHHNIPYGKGHFRWNFQAYILNADEIKLLKKVFGF